LLTSVIVVSLLFISCAPPTQSELYGTYIADYKLAKEKLVLYEDGTFYQEVTLKKTGSKTYKTRGTWSYRPRTKGGALSGYIHFQENFMFLPNGHGGLNPDYARKPIRAALPVTRILRITIGSEGRVYKKTD
jgi:hypothetical protein